MPHFFRYGELNICSLYENLIKLSKREDRDYNLAFLCSIGYFIWLGRNNVVFNNVKPQNAHSIIKQAKSSITLDYDISEPQCTKTICLPSSFKEHIFIMVYEGYNANESFFEGSYGYIAYPVCLVLWVQGNQMHILWRKVNCSLFWKV